MRSFCRALICCLPALLTGCVTTSMQGYADRDIPSQPVRRIAAYVSAPGSLASSLQSSIGEVARGRGIVAEDALIILPPTRSYTDAEIRSALAERGIDAVLLINVGDSGVIREYAGTVFNANYSGTSSTSGTVTRTGNFSNVSLSGSSTGTLNGSSTPVYRHSRQTNFSARLIDSKSSRNLWVGSGQVSAGGRLFVGDNTSSSSTVGAIFDDLQKKGLIAGSG